jgi:hypothetical protein
MNDMFILGGLFAVVAAGLFAFAVFHIYSGVKASLHTARVGEVYNFEYLQPVTGETQRFLARVIEPVYTLTQKDIDRLNRRSNYRRDDPIFIRTNHLVTCQTADGKIRNFYAERVTNCRKPLLAAPLFKAGLAHLF